jgi:hypothetical protein
VVPVAPGYCPAQTVPVDFLGGKVDVTVEAFVGITVRGLSAQVYHRLPLKTDGTTTSLAVARFPPSWWINWFDEEDGHPVLHKIEFEGEAARRVGPTDKAGRENYSYAEAFARQLETVIPVHLPGTLAGTDQRAH